jgi:hypothetical protein
LTDDSDSNKRGTKSVFSEIQPLGIDVEKLQNDADDIIRLTVFSIILIIYILMVQLSKHMMSAVDALKFLDLILSLMKI